MPERCTKPKSAPRAQVEALRMQVNIAAAEEAEVEKQVRAAGTNSATLHAELQRRRTMVAALRARLADTELRMLDTRAALERLRPSDGRSAAERDPSDAHASQPTAEQQELLLAERQVAALTQELEEKLTLYMPSATPVRAIESRLNAARARLDEMKRRSAAANRKQQSIDELRSRQRQIIDIVNSLEKTRADLLTQSALQNQAQPNDAQLKRLGQLMSDYTERLNDLKEQENKLQDQ